MIRYLRSSIFCGIIGTSLIVVSGCGTEDLVDAIEEAAASQLEESEAEAALYMEDALEIKEVTNLSAEVFSQAEDDPDLADDLEISEDADNSDPTKRSMRSGTLDEMVRKTFEIADTDSSGDISLAEFLAMKVGENDPTAVDKASIDEIRTRQFNLANAHCKSADSDTSALSDAEVKCLLKAMRYVVKENRVKKSPEERKERRKSQEKKVREKYDGDGDGKLDEDEKKKHEQKRDERKGVHEGRQKERQERVGSGSR